MKMDPFVSIVYCYRDRDLNRVRASLDSLRLQTNKNFTVFFVDYGSSTEMASKVESIVSEFDFVKYIYSDTRFMPWNRSHSLNIGIRQVSTQYVFTADIDMIFTKSFVETLSGIASSDIATFFKVAYLKKGADLVNGKLENQVGSYSADHALGLGMIPVEPLKKIQGYDEFYCFWGREDNDICYRLKQIDIQVNFHTNVLMYHMYHEPANTSTILPEKWLQFQNDYLHDSSKPLKRNFHSPWGRITDTSERVAPKFIDTDESDFKLFSGYSRYFNFKLDKIFTESDSGEVIKIQYKDTVSKEYNSRILTRFVSSLNKISSLLKLPFAFRSNYDYSYVNINVIRSEFFFWWASNKHKVQDFASKVDDNTIKIVIIKK